MTPMDTFDLKWPQSDATFFTDGWRCRIVWRERRGGLGGTIDNNDQAKRRVVASLSNVPYLLNALRARGHGVLAEELQSLCDVELDSGEAACEKPMPQARPAAEKTASKRQTAATPAQQVAAWLASLEGGSGWEVTGVRRAKVWQPCGEDADGALFLKAPAAGKSEWVLKRTYKSSKQKTEYLAAPALKGICEYLHQQGFFTGGAAPETWLSSLETLAHPDLARAASAWRASTTSTTH